MLSLADRRPYMHHCNIVTKGAQINVIKRSEALIQSARSTGTEIAIAGVPSGKVVQLITIKREEERKMDGQIHLYLAESEGQYGTRREKRTNSTRGFRRRWDECDRLHADSVF